MMAALAGVEAVVAFMVAGAVVIVVGVAVIIAGEAFTAVMLAM